MDKLPISDHLEKGISEYTLSKIVEQFEMVGYYDNLGHQLVNSVAFIALKRLALNTSADQSRVIAGLTEALDGAIDGLTNLGRCPDHPCVFCNAIAMTNRDNLTEALAEAKRIQEGK